MKNVIAIITSHRSSFHGTRLLVTLSACAGITDKLVRLATISTKAGAVDGDTKSREELDDTLQTIEQHHETVCRELLQDSSLYAQTRDTVQQLCREIRRLCEGIALLRECTPRSYDMLLSFGERLSTTIVTAGLQEQHIQAECADARQWIVTDTVFMDASPKTDATRLQAQRQFASTQADVIVIQGFTGSTQDGKTTTLGRGGSDLTASLLGAVLQAEEVQIWKEVDGILTTDPRIVPNAQSIAHLSFPAMNDLAYFGAKVLHPTALLPAMQEQVSVRIKNTFNPSHPGTLLSSELPEDIPAGFHAITLKKECFALAGTLLPKTEKNAFFDRLEHLFLNRQQEHLLSSSSARSFLCILSAKNIAEVIQTTIADEAEATVTEVAVLCVAGHNLTEEEEGSSMKAFNDALIPFQPLFIQRFTAHSAVCGVLPDQAKQALQAVHEILV
jgi:aspartate kinase